MNRLANLSALLLVLVTTTNARADILYAMDNGVLTHIDTDTLTATPIGFSGYFSVSGLEFGPNGQLYGISPDTDELLSIDITTGAATVIGPFNITVSRGSGMGWDPTTNQMYTVAKLTAGTPDLLMTVDLGSGGASFVAEITNLGFRNLYGLDFDASGLLYGMQGRSGSSQLWAIDKLNGNAVPIGNESLPPAGGFTIAPSGTAWVIEEPGVLYSVDVEDGSVVNHGLITGFFDGTASIGALASIPAPSSAVAVMAGLLLSHRRIRRSSL